MKIRGLFIRFSTREFSSLSILRSSTVLILLWPIVVMVIMCHISGTILRYDRNLKNRDWTISSELQYFLIPNHWGVHQGALTLEQSAAAFREFQRSSSFLSISQIVKPNAFSPQNKISSHCRGPANRVFLHDARQNLLYPNLSNRTKRSWR